MDPNVVEGVMPLGHCQRKTRCLVALMNHFQYRHGAKGAYTLDKAVAEKLTDRKAFKKLWTDAGQV